MAKLFLIDSCPAASALTARTITTYAAVRISMFKLRVGIVGLSPDWETRHRPALRALAQRYEVRAVCCEVAQRAEQTAAEFGAAPVDGFRALASRDDIDAVLILSADWYGQLPVLAACDQGKAVYCAPSIGSDQTQAEQFKERVEKSGVAFMAEFARRQMPATLRLKELIATRLGQPRLLFCHHRLSPLDCDARLGRGSDAPSPANRHLIELIDWCRYIVDGDPASVVGVRHNDGRQTDYHMMSLDFSPPEAPGSGAMAQISCSKYMPDSWAEVITFRPPADLQVCCERGIAFIDLPSSLVWFDEAGRHMESLDHERPVGEQLLVLFHRAVTSLVRQTSSLEEACRAVQILQAARRSSKSGQRIDLS